MTQVSVICFEVSKTRFAVEADLIASLISSEEGRLFPQADVADLLGITRWRTGQAAVTFGGCALLLGEDEARIETWPDDRIVALPGWLRPSLSPVLKPACAVDSRGVTWLLDVQSLVQHARSKDES